MFLDWIQSHSQFLWHCNITNVSIKIFFYIFCKVPNIFYGWKYMKKCFRKFDADSCLRSIYIWNSHLGVFRRIYLVEKSQCYLYQTIFCIQQPTISLENKHKLSNHKLIEAANQNIGIRSWNEITICTIFKMCTLFIYSIFQTIFLKMILPLIYKTEQRFYKQAHINFNWC